MSPHLNFTGVASRRKMGRFVDWLLEVLKVILTLALITGGLSLVLWRTLGVNPFSR